MFSLDLTDNVEMISVVNGGGCQAKVEGLLGGIEPGFTLMGTLNNSSGTYVILSSIFFFVGYIICCASSTGKGLPRGEITSFNLNYKSATAYSCYLPSHRAPYLCSKAPKDRLD